MPSATDPHNAIKTPPDNTRLWRYMRFSSFIDLLERGLWFSRGDLFDDKREGTFTDPMRIQLAEVTWGDGQKLGKTRLSDIELQYRRGFFANCWMQGDEDIHLWRTFGADECSIAITTTVGKIRKEFEAYRYQDSNEPIHVGAVNYDDKDIQGTNMASICMRKGTFFEAEKEVRLVVFQHYHPKSKKAQSWPKGFHVAADFEGMVDEVIVGPNSKPRHLNLVELVLQRYKINKPLRMSSITWLTLGEEVKTMLEESLRRLQRFQRKGGKRAKHRLETSLAVSQETREVAITLQRLGWLP